jgi:hypothetical protein
MSGRAIRVAACVVAGLACGDPSRNDDPFGSASGGGPGSAGTGSGADSQSTEGQGSEESGGPDEASDEGPDGDKLDVGFDTEGPSPECIEGECGGCTAVDILFVIDNSTSMGSYQQALAAAAPAFADAIFAALPPGTDLHVGVTTSSF